MRTLLTVLAMTIATQAGAQASDCAPRAAMIAKLATKYQETRRFVGLTNTGLIEIFASEERRTWTITFTLPNGIMCMRAVGQAFETDALIEGDPA